MSADGRGDLPLTSAQVGIWLAQQLDLSRSDYNIAEYFDIRGELDVEHFRTAVRVLQAETDALNVRFVVENGEVRQVPVPYSGEDVCEVVDLTSRSDPPATAVALMREALARPVDLVAGRLGTVVLYRLGPERFFFLHGRHHLIADGFTGSLLSRRIADIYTALVEGARIPVVAPASPRRMVEIDDDYRTSEAFAQDRAYWLARMSDPPEPVGFGGRSEATPCGRPERCAAEFTQEDTEALRTAARAAGTGWPALVYAAAAAYLHGVSGAEDVVVAMPVTGRTTPETREMRGVLSNILPLRLAVRDEMTLRELVRATSTAIKEALRHQRYPREDLRRDLGIGEGDRELWGAEVNIMSFDYDLTFAGASATAHNLGVGPVDHLSFNIYNRRTGTPFAIQGEYDSARGSAPELAAHQRRFMTFLSTFAHAGNEATVGDLEVLTPAETAWLLAAGDGGTAPVPDRTLHELFEDRAARTPDATAVRCGDEEVGYRELDQRAEAVAARLREVTVPEQRVGVCVERSADMVAALLGVLKAGCAYVPLDPGLPAGRLRFIARDAGIEVAVTRRSLAERLPADIATKVLVTADHDAETDHDAGTGDGVATGAGGGAVSPLVEGRRVLPANAAYVLYTSGSTGRPKGVVVSHASAVNFVVRYLDAAGFEATDRCLGFAALTFDVSVLEVFGSLLGGLTLVLATDEERTDADRLQALLKDREVTVADLPTALLPLLDPAELPALRFLSVGGEAPSGDAVDRWTAPGRQVWNTYGPTETVVVVTMQHCTGPSHGRTPPIGRPTVNHRGYVVDRRLRLVPPGFPGELCVAGAGVARGYLGNPALTAQRFVPDPWAAEPGTRMYRTGDLVRWTEDGELEFLGRIDQQVKINGHRIELGEIEAELSRHPRVAQCAVVVRELSGTGRSLVAYVVGRDGAAPGPEDLQRHLAQELPRYMVPHHYLALAGLPLTVSGKLDRSALPAPQPRQASEAPAPQTPREALFCSLFAEALRTPAVAADDNFFTRGGDSITAITLVSRARAAGIVLTLRDVFAHKTAAALAAAYPEDGQPAAGEPESARDSADAHGQVPLTPVMHALRAAGGPIGRFSQSALLQVPPGAGRDPLVTALQTVLDHHDALRTRVLTGTGPADWTCVITPPGSVAAAESFLRVGISGLPDEDVQETIGRETQAALGRLDPTAGRMLQAVWFDAGVRGPGRLLLVLHHLVVDGVSWRILPADLAAAWEAATAGRPAALPAPTTPFRSWARRTAALARADTTVAELPYWLDVTAGSEPLLGSRPLDPGQDTVAAAGRLTVTLPDEVARPLLTGAPAAFATGPQELLLAALAVAVRRRRARLGQPDGPGLLLDLEGHGRGDGRGEEDLTRTVGWFTTQYPLRVDLDGLGPDGAEPAYGPLVQRVTDALRGTPDAGTGYGLLRYLNPETGPRLAAAAAPQILFNYLGRFESPHGDWLPAPEADPLRADSDPAMPLEHALEVNVLARERDGRLELDADWTWASGVLGPDEAAALADDWTAALRRLAGGPDGCDGPGEPAGTAPAVRAPLPQDFPLVRLDRAALAGLLARHPGTEDVLPLAPLQSGMYFHASFDEAAVDAYTGQVILDLHGELDVAALRAAGGEVIRRHPALRAGFTDRALPEAVQFVLREVELPVAEADLSGLGPQEREAALERLLTEDRLRRFDLAAPPLLRLTAVRLEPGRHRLVLTNHHILWDGWSTPLILTELLHCYAARTAGAGPRADRLEPARPFRSYLEWLDRQDRPRALSAWRQALDGLAAPTVLAGADPHRMDTLPRRVGLELDEETTGRLTEFARGRGLTLSSVVQGAWGILLGRLTGHCDVVFGGVVSGRTPELDGVEGMVGLFINTLPVRFRVRPGEPLVAALERFQDEQAALLEHQHVSLSDVQEAAGLGTLFDTVVAFENYPLDQDALRDAGGGLRIVAARATDATHYSVNLVALPGPRLRFDLDHRPEVLAGPAAERLVAELRDLLVAVAEDPETTVDAPPAPAAETGGRAGSAEDTTAAGVFEAPASETEELIADVWSEVLERSPVGRRDNFFLSGGQSLKAMRVASRLRSALDLELPLRLVFENPTLAELATAVEAALLADLAPEPATQASLIGSHPQGDTQ
ncbi:non-ribosomal peptide synthetase [Streptomyces fuscichromogenes]|uniref:Carrier domain-containing protein n=1 Tax=Streptomyces fuscichromogenes TaxID=1324013 RepID=A0A918CWZ3_9ACTN|nr:non-ribosomal peptide synthetase [Streptomyces fuscichromogenes]GGN42463.1 hypothetical protein GCM10011578_091790 [Streptomyces fuscichromogenes]